MTENTQVGLLAQEQSPTGHSANGGQAVHYRPPTDVGAHQLRVAMTWVRRGVPVVPCSRTSKAPLEDGFGKDRPTEDLARFSDPGQVERWWTGTHRRAHVGLLTGRGPGRGLVVVDLDVLKPTVTLPEEYAGVEHGAEVLERRMPAGAEWPITYTVSTPSGGQHMYFWQPEEGPLIGCATGAKGYGAVGPLVDVRGVGGVIIAAGSYSSAQGSPYYLASPASVPVQPLPGWLLEILRPAVAPAPARRPAPVRALPTGDRAERYAAAALRRLVDELAALGEGDDRRDRTYAAARRLGELSATAPRILTEGAVREELLAAALACGIKGGQRQAEKCIRNGWSHGISKAMGGAA